MLSASEHGTSLGQSKIGDFLNAKTLSQVQSIGGAGQFGTLYNRLYSSDSQEGAIARYNQLFDAYGAQIIQQNGSTFNNSIASKFKTQDGKTEVMWNPNLDLKTIYTVSFEEDSDSRLGENHRYQKNIKRLEITFKQDANGQNVASYDSGYGVVEEPYTIYGSTLLIGVDKYLTLHLVENDNFDGSSSIDILRTDDFPQLDDIQPTTIEKLYASESDADYFYEKLVSSLTQYNYQVSDLDEDGDENYEDADDER